MSLVFVILVASLQLLTSNGAPAVPCLFIFGDSLSDSGNNNPLISWAKANYLPYGIDFPGGPTGRFCNGRTTIDLVGNFFIIFLNQVGKEFFILCFRL